MSLVRLARPEIQALSPYGAAVQVRQTVRLNANEAPWTSATDTFRRPLNRYPEIRPAALTNALAKRFGAPPEQLLVTRGTSEAIDLVIRSFCRAGRDNIVIVTPTFSMYAHYAAVQGALVNEAHADRDRDFRFDARTVDSACDEDTRLVFLCSPNNPTGTSIPPDTLRGILEARRGRSAVVVDEAYIEFSRAASTAALLGEYDNLLVLRTLSKALACAGARCGAVMGPRDVIAMLSAVQAPYAMSTPVVECVENALGGAWLDEAERRVAEVIAARERLAARLPGVPGLQRLWPSDANFLLAAFDDVAAVIERARAANILLRYFGGALSDCVRITVGTADENDRLLAALGARDAARG